MLCVSHVSTIVQAPPPQSQLELLLASPGGDLVLGECKMRVGDVVAAGAVHSWFPFIDAGEPTLKTGELLMAIQAKNGKNRQRETKSEGQPVWISLPS